MALLSDVVLGSIAGRSLAIQVRFEPVETVTPEAAVGVEPLGRFYEGRPVEAVHAVLPALFGSDQIGVLEDAQVPGDRRKRNIEGLSELAGCTFLKGKLGNDGPAGGIGEGSEGQIKCTHLTNMLNVQRSSFKHPVPGDRSVDDLNVGKRGFRTICK